MTAVAYPMQFEADVVLRTGHTLHLRPIRPDDRERLLAFYGHLSPETLHARFFDLCTPERALTYSPADVDYDREFGVIGENLGGIVAVAHYFASRRRPDVAEVAFAIADSGQGCGIGTKLLEVLIAAARTHGIHRFEADVLSDNERMLDVFFDMGFVIRISHALSGIAGNLLVAKLATEWSCASGSFSAVPPIESPSPPALFSWGRRCRRRMRGRFTRALFVRDSCFQAAYGPATQDRF